MALSAPGIGSNLDINGILAKLMQVESQPLNLLNRREATYQARLSGYGVLKGALAAFHGALQNLKTASRYEGYKAASGNPEVIAASAGGNALAGSHAIVVTALARPQTQASAARYADTTAALGLAGDLELSAAGEVFTIEVAATDTLADIVNAINGAAGNSKVTASIVNDGSVPGNRLVLSARESGTANAVGVSGSLAATFSFVETQGAQNLAMSVNGIAISQPTNTVTGAIQGVTLTALKEGAATVEVKRDTATARATVEAFVKAYNDLANALKSLSAYNAETKKAAVLQGDATVRSIQSQLRAALGTTLGGNGPYQTLSDLGIAFQTDGTLKLEGGRLDAALAENPAAVAGFFSASGTDGGPSGVGVRLETLVGGLLGHAGILASATDGLSQTIKDIDSRRQALERRLVDIEARYRRQFTALDTLIANMNQTSTFLQQQLANLPAASRNN